jgi:anaerobic magnesium-protoporphyrin IX monomethyl ester cyclase
VEVQKYKSIWLKRHGYFSMNMVTTRGCPYHCNWCAKPIWGQRYNSRSPENVAAEMKWLKENFAPDHIWFADDILGLKPKWIERFAALLHEEERSSRSNACSAQTWSTRRPPRRWQGRLPDRVDRGGVRFAEDPRRDGKGRQGGGHLQRRAAAAGERHRSGILFAVRLPRRDLGGRAENFENGARVRAGRHRHIGSYPLPGTKFFERVKLELGEKQNWVDSDDWRCSIEVRSQRSFTASCTDASITSSACGRHGVSLRRDVREDSPNALPPGTHARRRVENAQASGKSPWLT